jgi:hypothetical protein
MGVEKKSQAPITKTQINSKIQIFKISNRGMGIGNEFGKLGHWNMGLI